MPKMKTKRAAAKRFRVTKQGRIKRSRAGKQHLNRDQRRAGLRGLRKRPNVDKADEQRIHSILPYGTGD